MIKDVEGNPIWENDIIIQRPRNFSEDDIIGIAMMDELSWELSHRYDCKRNKTTLNYEGCYAAATPLNECSPHFYRMEVIGNIFDNPELLEQGLHGMKDKKYNTKNQIYKGVPLKLIAYTENHFARLNAKRFVINNMNQNVWIPNCYLEDDGTIKANANIDFVFLKAKRQLELAGVSFNAAQQETSIDDMEDIER